MKDVIILCAGPSIKDLAKNINKFKELDVPYLLINGYESVYRDTFGSINKVPKYVSIYCDRDNCLTEGMVKEFEQNNTIFLTHDKDYAKVFRASVKDFTVINPDVDKYEGHKRTNSLIKMIVYLSSIGYKRIFIYGCDGYSRDGTTHYKQNKCKEIYNRERDTKDINLRMNGILDKYNLSPLVYNCCPTSGIECFNKITVEQSIDMLKDNL